MSEASQPAASVTGAAPAAELDARRYLEANCYYHPERMASLLCAGCGKALCYESAVRDSGGARCGECPPGTAPETWICTRCGWLAYQPQPACGNCGHGEPLVRRGEAPEGYWERRFRGYDGESRFWSFGITWLFVYGLGLLLGVQLPASGVPQPAAWWIYLGVMSCGCGLLAAGIAARASRYQIILSRDGVELNRRGKVAEMISWGEVLGLEFVPRRRPVTLIVHGPGRQIVLDRSVLKHPGVLALVRQHAAVVPPPGPEPNG